MQFIQKLLQRTTMLHNAYKRKEKPLFRKKNTNKKGDIEILIQNSGSNVEGKKKKIRVKCESQFFQQRL